MSATVIVVKETANSNMPEELQLLRCRVRFLEHLHVLSVIGDDDLQRNTRNNDE